MPQAVTHVIIALIVASIIRDFYLSKKDKRKFPLHYVLIAGIAGLLPDLDIIAYWGLHFFGFSLSEVHRTFTHTIFVPLIFLILAFAFRNCDAHSLNKRKMSLFGIFLMIALGTGIHLILDAFLAGVIRPFYPISGVAVGFLIENWLPGPLKGLFFPSLDAILLVLWLVYMELKHRMSDYI